MFIDGTDSLSSLSQQITACGNHTYATKVMAIERVLYRDIDMEDYILHSQNKGTKLYFSLSLASISFFFYLHYVYLYVPGNLNIVYL